MSKMLYSMLEKGYKNEYEMGPQGAETSGPSVPQIMAVFSGPSPSNKELPPHRESILHFQLLSKLRSPPDRFPTVLPRMMEVMHLIIFHMPALSCLKCVFLSTFSSSDPSSSCSPFFRDLRALIFPPQSSAQNQAWALPPGVRMDAQAAGSLVLQGLLQTLLTLSGHHGLSPRTKLLIPVLQTFQSSEWSFKFLSISCDFFY